MFKFVFLVWFFIYLHQQAIFFQSETKMLAVSTRRAFFMPKSQVIDSTDTSAACLRWYLSYPHFNYRFARDCLLAVKRAAVFLLSTNKQSYPVKVFNRTVNSSNHTCATAPTRPHFAPRRIRPREGH